MTSISASDNDSSCLTRLPLELREAIYEPTIDYTREVEVYSKCRPFSILTRVNKQLRNEVEALIARKKWPCKHTNFYFELWDPREDPELIKTRRGWGTDGMCMKKEHDVANTRCIRIICVHSGKDNPLAVTIEYIPETSVPATTHVQLEQRIMTVYGASERREKELVERWETLGESWGRRSKGVEATQLLIGMRVALHRVH